MRIKLTKIQDGPHEGFEASLDTPVYADNSINHDLIQDLILARSSIEEKETYFIKWSMRTRPFFPCFIIKVRYLRAIESNDFLKDIWKKQE